MTDKEKIKFYCLEKGISINSFIRKCNFSATFLNSGSTLGVDKLRTVLREYPDFGLNWFLFDQGNPIDDNQKIRPSKNQSSSSIDPDLLTMKNQLIESLREQIVAKDKYISALERNQN